MKQFLQRFESNQNKSKQIGSEDKNEVGYEAIDILEEEDTSKSKME